MLRRRWRASTSSSEILPGNIIAPEAGTLSTPGSELNIDTTHILAEYAKTHRIWTGRTHVPRPGNTPLLP